MTEDSSSQKDGQEQHPVVGVIDVKSPSNLEGIPWAIVFNGNCVKGNDLDKFVREFARLAIGGPALLGFEAPLFVPFGRQLKDINRARKCEKPAWSGNPGAISAAISLVVVPYTLQKLRQKLQNKVMTLDWRQPPGTDSCLIFEAFVSGKDRAPSDSGRNDVCPVAKRVAEAYPDLDPLNCICEERVFSTVGAALLRTGWLSDPGILTMPCMVVKP